MAESSSQGARVTPKRDNHLPRLLRTWPDALSGWARSHDLPEPGGGGPPPSGLYRGSASSRTHIQAHLGRGISYKKLGLWLEKGNKNSGDQTET